MGLPEKTNEALKAKIIPTLLNTARNEELLETIPHKTLLDLSVVYRYVTEIEGEFKAALVNHEALEEMEMSLEELDAMAKNNLKHYLTPQIFELMDTLLIITNPERIYGASAMLDTELLDAAAERMQGNFFVVPASMHEVLLATPKLQEIESLKSILNKGNDLIVHNDEFLSENIYQYDEEKKELIQVTFQER